MNKQYVANTPLILSDEHGADYRVERGETITLSDEQYKQVAAHVTPVDAPDPVEPSAKPKRGKTQDET